ncbi:MAG: hypothetical protein K6U12_05860 [Armatimonadetes bacterium]|nr:hypothetical protein [Armatimonadota bacterium]
MAARVWAILLGVWLSVLPVGAAWVVFCSCAPQEGACCAAQQACCQAQTPKHDCCSEKSSAPACERSCRACKIDAPQTDKALPARLTLEIQLWVLALPEPPRLEVSFGQHVRFGLPAVRNHSPPFSPESPRAPPLC